MVLGVVTFDAALDLCAPARQYGGVYVQGDGLEVYFVKEPAKAAALYPLGVTLLEALEQPYDGFVACRFAPTK